MKKGSQVYIEGKLQTRKWQDNSGIDRYTTEIIANHLQMLGSKPTENSNQNGYLQQKGGKVRQDNFSENDLEFNDDIPF